MMSDFLNLSLLSLISGETVPDLIDE